MIRSNSVNSINTLGRLSYTRAEAAKLLGVAPITIDRLTTRGLLRPSRATRRPLFTEAELLRFLNDTSTKGGTP